MPKTDLEVLLSQLDAETRSLWENYLESIDAEVSDKGPTAVRDHLDAALKHLLAVGWALHRCYSCDETHSIIGPLGDAATTVEQLRKMLDQLPKKPEWSQ
ncbi:MAG: hypothetical protein HY698_16520 [Deltaproteobacteria bacterium]|nr:hypothetical protein [Deltaproteobacteria bacterium]